MVVATIKQKKRDRKKHAR